jgi:citrate lyase subunit beta/citryl-CoA lyase/(S)-citramalyl-CoA lyase
MMYTRYCRSLLSTPASAVDRYASGHRSGADISMVDLEDSIPPDGKEKARQQAETFFSAPTAVATRCAVRINAVTDPDGLRDLLAIARYPVLPGTILVPMVESARDIEIVERVLDRVDPPVELLAVVETPRGLENVAQIAAASGRLRGLIFGSADYSFTVGARLSWETLVHARARVVNAARAAGVEVLDSPDFEVDDAARLRRIAEQARDLGFSGKIAIHPRQVPVINEVFSPDAATLRRARQVVAAGQANGLNVTVVDGMMVGLPFFAAAQRLIDESGE